MAKNFLLSWTIWFGFLQLALGAVGFMSGLMDHTQALTLMVTGVGSLGLRLKTTQPVYLPE